MVVWERQRSFTYSKLIPASWLLLATPGRRPHVESSDEYRREQTYVDPSNAAAVQFAIADDSDDVLLAYAPLLPSANEAKTVVSSPTDRRLETDHTSRLRVEAR